MIQPWYMEKTHTQPHSIEVSRNAKGEHSWVLKTYYADGEAEQTAAALAALDALLAATFYPPALVGQTEP